MQNQDLIKGFIQKASTNRAKSFCLSNKNLSSLPTDIGKLTDVEELDLNGNSLTILPVEITQLRNLKRLYLDDNLFEEFPEEIFKLKNLEKISINKNKIECIDHRICALTNLSELYFQDNLLTELPKEIQKLNHLKILDFSDNKIRTIPHELFFVERLEILNFNNNNLKNIPANISSSKNIKNLFIDNNHIENLPESICQLKKLSKLSINSNKLNKFPSSCKDMCSLSELYLSYNELLDLPDEFKELRNLKTIYLDNNKFEKIPLSICCIESLEEIKLCSNKLTYIPAEVSNLINLRKLFLSSNSIEKIPKEVKYLGQLTNLNMINNSLCSIPDNIEKLKNLKSLYLSNNNLSFLPEEIGYLDNLEELHLYKNSLESVPRDIGGLTKLSTLSLAHNKLEYLPSEIGNLKELKNFFADYNSLKSIPEEIGFLDRLVEFNLSNNPFNEIENITRDPVLQAHFQENPNRIVDFLYEYSIEKHREWTGKLIVVGSPAVGKTALLRKLTGEPFVNLQTTHGISIKEIEFPYLHQPDIQMSIRCWDFGGQEFYRSTHELFLTDRTVFLFVYDVSNDESQNKFSYWFDIISARAPKAPILVVENDPRNFKISQQFKQEYYDKYPQIKEFIKLDYNFTDITKLREKIRFYTSELPLMGQLLPKKWTNAMHHIRNLDDNKTFSYEKFLTLLTTKYNIIINNALELTKYLHDIGDIFHLSDNPDLYTHIFLDPQWISKCISKITENPKEILIQQEIFELWNGIDTSMYKELLMYMNKLGLVHEFNENDDSIEYLIVNRISKLKPYPFKKWDDRNSEHTMSMRFRFDSIIPRRLLGQFFSKTKKYHTKIYWKDGILLSDTEEENNIAIFEKNDVSSPYCKLTVRGNNPIDFFYKLKVIIENTLNDVNLVPANILIPCPGYHDNKCCNHEFDYKFVKKKFKHNDESTIYCPNEDEEIPVSKIFLGIDIEDKNIKRIESAIKKNNDFVNEMIGFSSSCPRSFTLRYAESKNIFKRIAHKFIVKELELQLLCEEEWHIPVNGNNEKNGCYKITQSKEWIKHLLPYVKAIFNVLTSSTVSNIILKSDHDDSENNKNIELMCNLIKDFDANFLKNKYTSLEDIKEENLSNDHEKLQGSDLRQFETILSEIDKTREWGGLTQVKDKDNLKWVCKQCYEKKI